MRTMRIFWPMAMCIAVSMAAQVHTDRPLRLIGPEPSDRQVTGLPVATEPSAILTVGVEQAGTYRLTDVADTVHWEASLAAHPGAPVAGTHVVVRVPATSTGRVSLTINGHGPSWVMYGTDTLEAGSLASGDLLSLVHDGTVFHVLNGRTHLQHACPSGMVAISGQVCIDSVERSPVDLYTAAANCAGANKRLCTWSEFYIACRQRTALGLQAMLNDWEWTDDACNEDNSVRLVGVNTCEVTSTRLASGPATSYRCCYTR